MALTIIYILDSTRFEMVLCSLYNFIEIEKKPEISPWRITILLSGFMGMVFNTNFNNISVISWLSVLLVEETGVLPKKTTDIQRDSNSQR